MHQGKLLDFRVVPIVLITILLLGMYFTSSVSADESDTGAEPASTTEVATDIPTDTPTDIPTEQPIETPTDTVPPTEIPTLIPTVTEASTDLVETATFEPTLAQTVDSPLPTSTATPTATIDPSLLSEPALGLLYSDNFDSGNLTHWVINPGWAIVPHGAGEAVQVFNSNTPLKYMSDNLSNVVVQASFLLDYGSAQINVRESIQGAYTVTLDSNRLVSLYRGSTLLQAASIGNLTIGQWHTLRLSAISDTLRVSVNGAEIIALRDPSPLPAGTISMAGLFAPDANALAPQNTLSIDDFYLWVPAAQMPTAMPTLTPSPTATPTRQLAAVSMAMISAQSICDPNAPVTLASMGMGGVPANGRSYSPAISDDGRYVTFVSAATNLVMGDANARDDVFIYDRVTCTLSLISVAASGTSSGNGDSVSPSISPDGRYIAFQSAANNLIPNFSGNSWFIYLRDTQTNTTTLISKTSAGTAPNAQSRSPFISSSGRYITYQSQATNISGTGSSASPYYTILLYDRQTDLTTLVAKTPTGTWPSNDSSAPKFSTNERYVAYSSSASNIIVGDTNAQTDVFAYDRDTDTNTRVSLASDGTQGNSSSSAPTISGDGRYVTFASLASNLVPGLTGNASNIFLRDRDTGQTTLITPSISGSSLGAGGSSAPDISNDGRYIQYLSNSSNLVYGDTNNVVDSFVYDRQNSTLVRASLRPTGVEANGAAIFASMSDDGNIVAYTSAATNLVTGDTNGVDDLFIANLSTLAPSAPANLQAPLVTKTELTISWADTSVNETDFRIERSTDGTNWTEIATVGANTTTFADSSLTCNTLYSYRLRAYRSGDGQYSAYSSVFNIRTQICTPVQPGPTFTVNQTADINDTTCTEDNCSLREAVIAARNYVGGTTIVLPAGTFTLSKAGKNEDAALTGDLDLAGNITITGAGATATIIDGGGIDRVFQVLINSTVTISNVTIQNGLLTLNSEKGGAMLVNANGVVNITGSHIRNNTAYTAGAILLNYGAVVTLTESTIFSNSATYTGGAFGLEMTGGSSSTLNLIRSTVSANTASQGAFADLRNSNINLTDSTVFGSLYAVGGHVTNINSIQDSTAGSLPQDNGGPTWTLALAPDSNSIGASANCGSTDQRGQPRDDGGCDAGAYEADYPPALYNFAVREAGGATGALTENAVLKLNVVSITARFSENMSNPAGDSDPNDVTNPANYLLVSAGADGSVQTTACGAVQGDDLSISVNAVTFDAATNVATLSINGGAPLISGTYRFLICGTGLRDLDGNQLDVNRDGVGTDEVFALNFIVAIPQTGPVFIPNTTEDTNDGVCGVAQCSLREAIIAANVVPGGEGVVQIPAGVYTLTRVGNDNTSALGDLDVSKTMQIIGAGAANTIIDGNQIDRVLHILGGSRVTLGNLTIRNGRTIGTGGNGGGILIETSVSVDIINVFVLNNRAGDTGGGLSINSGTAATTTITNSVISGNQTTGDTNPASYGRGGGIFNWGKIVVTNSTISGNSTNRWGGGILNYGDTTLNNVTITGNTANSDNSGTDSGGGMYNPTGTNLLGIVKLQNTIIAGNFDLSGQAPDCGGNAAITSQDYNLIGSLTGCTTLTGLTAHNITGVNPLLGNLADNGGATLTHALLDGSPAINSGNQVTCQPNDQRGVFRPQGAACDIGAFEFIAVPITTIPPTIANALPISGFYVREFDVTFSEGVQDTAGSTNANDVTNPNNYRLVQPGTDKIFQTSTCAALAGDDAAITVDSVSYNSLTNVAAVIVNGNTPVPPNYYRLLVCAGILDTDNNLLDGNLDGAGGDDYHRDYLIDSPQTGPNFTVNTTADETDSTCGILHCSLRDAVRAVNALSVQTGRIDLPAGTYNLSVAGASEDLAMTGDLDVTQGATIAGAGAATTVINGNGLDRVFHIRGGVVNLVDLTIQGGQSAAGQSGGGIYNNATLNVTNSIIQNNSATSGGAIYNAVNLTLKNTTIQNNTANGGQGGGIDNRGSLNISGSTFTGNTSTNSGGAIYNQSTAQIDSSTLNGNSALQGGGIENHKVSTTAQITLTNTTISGNLALQNGGGISSTNAASTVLTNVTLANNSGDSDNNGSGQGGGLYLDSLSSVTLKNTLVAGNIDLGGEAPDCATEATGSTYTSLGYNLIGTISGCTITGTTASNITDVNAQIGVLQDNGGATLTHALLANSPAIDAGTPSGCPGFDQRGVPRPVGATCDIGAIEYTSLGFNQIPPIVLNVDTITGTGDGKLDEGEFTTAPIQSFIITWNQDIFDPTGNTDPADVTNPANYRLLRPGADGLYQTTSCGIVNGDDQAIVVNSAAYANRAATINVNGGTYLGGSSYRLLICDPIQGINGSSMDGNRDGQPGGNFARSFTNDPLQTGAVINVTTSQDVNDGQCTALNCSLREAIRQANVSAMPSITINVPSGLYSLTISGRGEDSAGTGDLDINRAMTIQGSGAATTIIDAGALDRIFDVRSTTTITTIAGFTIRNGADTTYSYGMGIMNRASSQLLVRDSIVTSNSYTTNGGGIANLGTLTLLRTTVENNKANYGGGIYSTQSLTITDSTIRNNQALTGASSPSGGGIYATNSLNISGTTINGNQTSNYGGGVYYNSNTSSPTSGIVNSTISGNVATSGGGGVYILSLAYAGQLYFNNVTVTANQTQGAGAGIYVNSSTAYLQNSIIAGNQDTASIYYHDFYGYVYSQGYNLIGTLSGLTIDGDTATTIINPNPQLGALQNNGGTTLTHALLAGSPAIDAGNPATCAATDQRNAARPVGAACDMGAYEANGTLIVPPTPAQVTSVGTVYGTLNEGANQVGYITTLQVSFSKAMRNPAGDSDAGDVTNPANYVVVGDGLDGIFQTTTCAAHSSDTAISVNSVSYDATAKQATLNLNDGQQLPQENYRLLLCDSLQDIDGLALDGNGDSTTGGMFWRNFSVSPIPGGPVFTVTTTTDKNDGLCTTTDCSLREAIINANQVPGPQTVVIPNGTYILTIVGRDEDQSKTGDLDIRDTLTITGSSLTIIDGNQIDRVFHIPVAVSVNISGITVQNGMVGGNTGEVDGGGILSENGSRLTVSNSLFRNNHADRGGAIMAYHDSTVNGAVLSVDLSVFTNNSATTCGAIGTNIYRPNLYAAISNSTFTNNTATGFGGAICSTYGMQISNSTIANNTSGQGAGGIGVSDTVLTIVNSTITGNTTTGNGGGISGGSGLSLNNVTIANNQASGDGGGVYAFFGTPHFKNTIIYGNTDTGTSSPDCAGTFVSEGYNLVGSLTGCSLTNIMTGVLVGQNPGLGPLQDNGGSTPTRAIATTSPALDAGNNLTCAATDQRGVSRPLGAACDIGAFELFVPPPPPSPTALDTPPNGAFIANSEPDLTWNTTANAVNYQVQVDNNSTFASPNADKVLDETNFTPDTLPDGSYSWRVRGTNSDGISGQWSTVRSFTVDTTVPDAPALTLPAADGVVYAAQPTWTWNAPLDAIRYQIQVSASDNFTSSLIDTQVTTARYPSTISLPQGAYSWHVRSQDAAGNWSDFSPTAHFNLIINKLPASSGYSLDTTPTFTWYAYPGATRYQFQLSNDPNFGSFAANFITPTASTLTYTSTILSEGVYYWRVNVDLGAGFVISPFAWTLTISPALPVAPLLDTPTNVALTNTPTPELKWAGTTSTVGAPFSYEIQIDTDSAFRSPDASAVISDTTFTPSALADARYYWRVRTQNHFDVAGQWSAVRSFTVDASAPAVPALALPAPDSTVYAARPTWTWNAPLGATRYQIQVSASDNFTSSLIDTQVTTARYPSTISLPQGSYSWHVHSQDAAGNWSDFSPTAHFNLVINKLPAANGYSLDTTPTFTWYAYTGATRYQFQLSTDPNFGGFVAEFITPTASTLTYTSTILSEGVYYWRVNVDLGAGFIISPLPWTLTVTPKLPLAPLLSTPANAALLNTSTPQLKWAGTTSTVGAPFDYEIQIDTDSAFRSPDASAVISGTTFTPGALADARYYWRVRTRNYLSVPGAWSAVRYFTIDTSAPAVPTLALPAADGTTYAAKPTWTWNAPLGATRYQIQVSASDNFTSSLIDTQVTTARYPSTISLPQGSYSWHVRSQDAAGNWSTYSPTAHFNLVIHKLPAANGYSVDTTPTFTWYAYTGATRYQFQLSTDPNFGGFVAEFITPTASTLTYTSTILSEGVYYWRVNVDLGAGFIISPLPWTLTVTPKLPLAPLLSTPANAALLNTPTPLLKWAGTSSIVGAPFDYEIQIDTDSAFRSPDASALVSTTTFTPSALPDARYYWRIRTRNYLAVSGAWSIVRYFTVDGPN